MGEKSTLGYWNTRAICEPIRLLLHFAGEEFEDVRYVVGPPPTYNKSEWTNVKHNLGLAVPNLPYYKDASNGLILTETNAILLYLGEKYNLAGQSIEDRARAAMIMEGLRDWIYDFFNVTYCNIPSVADHDRGVHIAGEDQCINDPSVAPSFQQCREKYLNETLPTHLNIFSNILEDNLTQAKAAGTSTDAVWLVGSTISYADLILFEYVDQHIIFHEDSFEQNSLLLRHREQVLALPAVHRYVTARSIGGRSEPLHNRYSHFHRGWISKQ